MLLNWHHQMFLSGHYAGQDLVPKIRGGEPWKKVFGPVYIYLNSGSTGDDPLWLWEDAKIKVCLMASYLL
jgi:rhamnogalacturonan endolyase